MGSDRDAETAEVAAVEEELGEEAAEGARGGFDRWRKESPIGGIGTGIARGLQAVFAPPADEVTIVAALPGEPPDADQRVRVILDLDDPTKSIAIMPETPVASSPSDVPKGRTDGS